MKKAAIVLAFFCSTIFASEQLEEVIDRISTSFNQMPEIEKIEAVANSNNLPGWIAQAFPEEWKTLREDKTALFAIVKKVDFKNLVPKVKKHCKTRLCPVLQCYIDHCEDKNIKACTIEIRNKNTFRIHSTSEIHELLEEYLTKDQFIPLFVVTSIHNETRNGELNTLFQ